MPLESFLMIAAPTIENEPERARAIDGAMCSLVPREERFDRITRTVMRLLEVPIALISIVDEDIQWFRSVQGLDVAETPRDISFCGHAIVESKVLMVPDVSADPRFWDNPLVTGPPHIRSYIGVPLSLAPGVRVGTLCAIDTQTHAFQYRDIVALQDLAAMAEAELKLDAMSSVQKRLLIKLDKLERRARLDPLTGCWNVRGFRELVTMAVQDAQRDGSDLALCYVRVDNFDGLAGARAKPQVDAIQQVLAQVLRQRLPDGGALAGLGAGEFCGLIPGSTALAVEENLGRFTFPRAHVDIPGMRFDLELDLRFGLGFLRDMKSATPATEIWARALAEIHRK